jgi:L-ascorbate metabolism protein UlaG (beta-lactamase superfamily)
MRLTWFGHSCFLLETGTHRLLFDPWLNQNPVSPVKAADVRCDFIFCSHAHEDHTADALEIARNNHAPIVAPYELAEYFAAQGAETVDLMQGGSASLAFGRVKLTPAIHSSALELGNGRNLPLGEPGGFIVSAEGKKVYHAGDTALFSDMQLIGRAGLDLALLPIGDWYTMGIDDAVDALDLLVPRLAVPMHYNTHDKIRVDPQAFVDRAAARGQAVRVLTPGGSLEF